MWRALSARFSRELSSLGRDCAFSPLVKRSRAPAALRPVGVEVGGCLDGGWRGWSPGGLSCNNSALPDAGQAGWGGAGEGH